MKHLILYLSYISLLIFSGLISPFYNKLSSFHQAQQFSLIKERTLNNIIDAAPFSFFDDVVVSFFPVLKN